MNTFNDDNELGLFEEPRSRPPRERPHRRSQGRPQRSGGRRSGPTPGSSAVLRLAGLIVLGIAIVLGLVLSCSGRSKGDYSSYIAAMQPLAQNSASVGAKFATALGTPGLTMESFQSDLADWKQQELNAYVAAQRLRPPGPLQSAHAEALATFQLRARSLDGISTTLTVAKEKHDSAAVAAAALAGYAQLFTASDVLWEQLYKLAGTQVLTEQNVTNVIVPASRIVTSPDIVSPHSLAILYQRVGTPASTGGNGAGGVHGSALLSTNAVESGVAKPLSTSTGTTVFASSTSLVINVVFEDSGDFPEVQVPVTLTVKVGGEKVYTHTETVSQVAAHSQATVSFSNLSLPPSAFGHNAFINVSIARVKGEARLDNNAASYPVFFRLAAN